MKIGFEQFLSAIVSARRWRRGARIAPHKPLVMLAALSALERGVGMLRFEDTERSLRPLVGAHWSAPDQFELKDPFIRLIRDGIWKVSVPEELVWNEHGPVSRSRLIEMDVRAGFKSAVAEMLLAEPERITWATRILLFELGPSAPQEAVIETLDLFAP